MKKQTNQPITYNFTEGVTKKEGSLVFGSKEGTPYMAVFSGPGEPPILIPLAAAASLLADACGGPEMLETFAKMLEGGQDK